MGFQRERIMNNCKYLKQCHLLGYFYNFSSAWNKYDKKIT